MYWLFQPLPAVTGGSTIILVTAATITYGGQSITVNAKTNVSVTAAGIIYGGQLITVANVTYRPVDVATIVLGGQAIVVNARHVAVAPAVAVTYAPQTVNVQADQDLYVTVTAAAIDYGEQPVLVSHGVSVEPANENYQPQPVDVFNLAGASDRYLSRVSITIGVRTG